MFGENPDLNEVTKVKETLYFTFTFIINIVVLNLLISIIGDAYDESMSAIKATELRQKCNLLQEWGLLKQMLNPSPKKNEAQFVHLFAYKKNLREDSNQGEWIGRVKVMLMKLDKIYNEIKGTKV